MNRYVLELGQGSPFRTLASLSYRSLHQVGHSFRRAPIEAAETYDDRGAGEVEIQADHTGLLLRRRRKRCFAAQEMLVLLNDLAHNWLAWLYAWVLKSSPFDGFGLKRIIRDLLTIPGEAFIAKDELIELRLKASHPYAAAMVDVLEHLWQTPTH